MALDNLVNNGVHEGSW